MGYDCITCGPLKQEYHDGRDFTLCSNDCIPAGECQHPDGPPIQSSDGHCYWDGFNGQGDAWYLPDPAHQKRTEDDLPAPYKPLPGQIGFDGIVVT